MARSSLAAEIAAANAEITTEEFSLQEWRLVCSRWRLLSRAGRAHGVRRSAW